MKKSRKALLTSAMSLLLCFTMLLGTTYAWFTDSVTSTNNIIQAGNLDIELEYWDKDAGKWESVKEDTPLFEESTLWEPGYTQVVYLRAANKGTLALKYQLGINIVDEKAGTRVDEDGNNVSFKLSDSIYMGVVENVNGEIGAYATREVAVEAVKNASGIISKGFNKYGDMDAGVAEQYLALVVYMPESVGNEANYKTDTEAPKITLGIRLLATQKTNEEDSFGSDYDAAAKHPYGDVNYTATEEIPAEKISTDADGVSTLAEPVVVGNESDGIYAEVPAEVKLADGTTELALTVQAMDESSSEAVVTLDSGESKQSLNIHIDGIAEDNDTPMLITLEGLFDKGLNTTSVAMYHVEDGVTVAMTLVDDPVNHNEFSYDPATGDVVLCVKSFSEYVTVEDDLNPWEGTAASGFNGGTGTADEPYVIATAEQLAYFGLCVDNGNTFANEYVALSNDIDLGGTVSFNPIGFKYAYEGGQVFKGTFDGGIYDEDGNLTGQYTIRNLYQNGWKLGLSYSTAGGGLFASVEDATIKNLTMVNANIVMECIEMGVVAGLAQGNCIFDNITISNCSVANYQRATGGVVGEVSPKYDADGNATASVHKFTNILIDANTVVGSLWGDFDTPVGGVIGAYWDDASVPNTKVEMSNVTVAARLDVYNDVTSTYQWYAYRRDGMLIGNSDRADGHTATATYLTCENVTVYYGPWTDYHYCEFNNHNSNWPFVRVEKGENCEAFSNPRWGVPNSVSGVKVTPENHTSKDDTGIHLDGDDCMVSIPFGQLYGGGQGVYGQTEHENVKVVEYLYTVTYVNDSEVLDVKYVTEDDLNEGTFSTQNGAAEDLVMEWADQNITITENVQFGGWMNAGSTAVTVIPAGNKENIVLYPFFKSPYTASFVDQSGNILAWCFFFEDETDENLITTTRESAENKLVFDEGFSLDKWKVHITDENGSTTSEEDYDVSKFASYTTDVTIYPIYKYLGDVNLIPVDKDGDGDTDYYQVGGYSDTEAPTDLVVIPNEVNGVPVTTINVGAFSSYADLHSVVIPENVTDIGAKSFAEYEETWLGGEKAQTITLYYEGDPEKWKAYMTEYANGNNDHLQANWDNAMGENSRIFFLDENGEVDLDAGYYERCAKTYNDSWSSFLSKWSSMDLTWVYHGHPYPEAAEVEDGVYNAANCLDNDGNPRFHSRDTDYTGDCGCDSCNGDERPDARYWTTETTT